MSPEKASETAEREYNESLIAAVQDLDVRLESEKQLAKDKLDNGYEKDVAAMKEQHRIAKDILVNGLEHVRAVEHKKLEDALAAKRAKRQRELEAAGIAPENIPEKLSEMEKQEEAALESTLTRVTNYDQVANLELKSDDEKQIALLEAQLAQEAAHMMRIPDDKAKEVKALKEDKASILSALQGDGLKQLMAREKEQLEIQIAYDRQARAAALASEGLTPRTIDSRIDAEQNKSDNSKRAALEASHKKLREAAIAQLDTDDSDEGKRRREAHQRSAQKLEDQFAETKRKEKKHLEERLMAKRNTKKEVYIDTVFIVLIKCMHALKIERLTLKKFSV